MTFSREPYLICRSEFHSGIGIVEKLLLRFSATKTLHYEARSYQINSHFLFATPCSEAKRLPASSVDWCITDAMTCS